MKKVTFLLIALLSVDSSKTESKNVANLANGAKCIHQSEQYDAPWHCDKALDGVSKSHSGAEHLGGWATKGQGIGASMTIQFAGAYTINRIRLMQRWFYHILAKYIQLQFQDGSTEEVFTYTFNFYL